jgi:hypothetical protein
MPQLGRSVATRAEISGAIYASFDFHAGRHIDLTGDSLTREQFLLSQLLLSGAASHDVVDIIYDRYRTINTDNDDAITREEFLAHVHNRHEHRAPTPAHVKLARKLSARLHV